jgi:hypothetical protein
LNDLERLKIRAEIAKIKEDTVKTKLERCKVEKDLDRYAMSFRLEIMKALGEEHVFPTSSPASRSGSRRARPPGCDELGERHLSQGRKQVEDQIQQKPGRDRLNEMPVVAGAFHRPIAGGSGGISSKGASETAKASNLLGGDAVDVGVNFSR